MERDAGKRKQMWEYSVNLREQIRRQYLNFGPLQVHLKKYPAKGKQDRRFQFAWFKIFPNWLEYSITKDCAYCFLCFLFSDKHDIRHGYDAFTVTGFDNWNKVNGKNCSFLKHFGSSQHRKAVASSVSLLNQEGHIENIIEKQSAEKKVKNRTRLKASIDIVRWLSFQAIAFRGHDETPNSKNRGNFIEMLTLLASYNDELAKIRHEVGDSYFCVMVDEAPNESQQEQMAIVLRFVDKDGLIKERFLSVLVLVASSREVIPVQNFFTKLACIINVVCASSKRHDELQKAKADDIKCLLELGEIKSGKVLKSIIEDGCYSQRGDAAAAYDYMISFEFKSQDIGNAIHLVSATKESLNNFRNSGWDSLLEQVIIFCDKHKVNVPDFKAPYKSTRYRPRGQDNQVSVEHFYKVDIFICTLDKQLNEMASRFDDHAMELLTLASLLVPKRISKVCDTHQICHLVKKYYPADFTEHEMIQLRYQLEIFKIEFSNNSKLMGATTIAELCKILVETQKCEVYSMIDRVFRLILTLPVSTATTERAFSAMKLCQTRLRNKMSDDFLADNLVVYIEKDIAERFDSGDIIDEFKDLKGRRAEL
ncbi:uncharacterized protein [Rutidosis leptorrhynchoides]|uniref:uncharacterized protein n=1 Tax=Rutidosis leptorrhynchoides TaxID=125765 RepID=UPI003A9A63F4